MTDETGGTYEPGTRAAAVLLIKAAAEAVAELDSGPATEEEAAVGLVAIGHAATVASVHAQLAIEARLGEVAENLAEVARLLRPRSVDLGPIGIVHNPHGLSTEDVNAAYARAEAIAHARKTGQTPDTGR